MEGGGRAGGRDGRRLDCSVSDVLMEDAYHRRTCARGGPSGERHDCLRLVVCVCMCVHLGDRTASLKEGKDVMHVKRHQPVHRNQRRGWEGVTGLSFFFFTRWTTSIGRTKPTPPHSLAHPPPVSDRTGIASHLSNDRACPSLRHRNTDAHVTRPFILFCF